jgi:hypothetical protein
MTDVVAVASAAVGVVFVVASATIAVVTAAATLLVVYLYIVLSLVDKSVAVIQGSTKY